MILLKQKLRPNIKFHVGSLILTLLVATIATARPADIHAASAVCNPNATTIKEAVCLEDLNWHVEHTMAFDVVYKLIDPRDGEEYSVGRLRDERVWLLDNLRLGGEEEIVLNSETSNIPEGATFTLPSSDTWENTYEEPYIGTSDKNTATAANEDWKVGNHYNFCAASAGTVCDPNGEATEDAQYDICPAGWQLPTVGESSSDLNYLYSRLNNSTSRIVSDLHIALSGRYYNGGSGYINEDTYIWSSTLRDGQRVRYLTYDGSNVRLNESYRRDRGYSIRCVAKKSERPIMTCNNDAKNINEATCLQDINPLVKASMTTGETYRLYDSRDSEQYHIAKLPDGNVWFLDNLMIGKGEEITLTSNDTNIAEGTTFTLPSTNSWANDYETPYLDAVHKHEVSSSSDEWHLGNYYNYCAASAGTVCDPEGENERDAEEDICPLNWRMPTGGINGEYGALLAALDYDSDLFVNTLRLPLSGRYYDDSQEYVSRDGYFWSSTYRDGSRMRYINYDGYDVNPAGSYNRDRGYSMRCVAKVSEFGDGDYAWMDVNEHISEAEEGLTLRVGLYRSAFIRIEVDGEELDEEAFELAGEDNTTILFKSAYLNTLAEGEHAVRITYQEGVVIDTNLVITIKEEEEEVPDVPNTGELMQDKGSTASITITGTALFMMGIVTTVYFIIRSRRIHYRNF